MLTLFMKMNCSSSREARMWLDGFSISYKIKSIRNMTQEELVKILSLTENGFEDIIIGNGTARAKQARAFIYRKSFNEAVDFLVSNPEFLRGPIVLDQNKIQVGFTESQMRKFIPREKRKLMKKKMDEELKNEM